MFNSFPASIFEKSCQPPPAFLQFSLKFHGPQNILLYDYLNMQYIKIKIRPSTLKKKNKIILASNIVLLFYLNVKVS